MKKYIIKMRGGGKQCLLFEALFNKVLQLWKNSL